MREVKLDARALMEILEANKNKHREMFLKALDGYQKTVVEELQKQLDRAKRGLKRDVSVFLTCPQDHTADYERVIQMLRMSVDNVVVLSQQEFSMYVQDDWGWKQQWTTSNLAYMGRADGGAT